MIDASIYGIPDLVLAEKAYDLYDKNQGELGKWDALTTLVAERLK